MEQMIIFVYDTGFCQTEADDPQKAVLFFHPHWVSDQQRLALCGQLMGAAHFCSSVFSSPRILTLQCGKLVLKKFGRYILSVGSDQSLPEWILQDRFNILELLVQFYHNSFDTIFSKVECDQEAFSKKLTEILEVYIPVLQFTICSVGNVFLVRCPKRSSSAFLEAFQLLEACCNFKGVLGGVVLHNSKVLATQLDPDITKLLALTDRFHMRSCAERIVTPFHLPVGVQLLKVYLKQKVYESLRNAVGLKYSTINGVQKKHLQKVVKEKKEEGRIFTVHEEESSDVERKAGESVPWEAKETTRHRGRKPKSKVESNTLKERSKSFVGGLSIKVCSTPTVEKTLIHEELVSICSSGNGGKVEPKAAQSTGLAGDGGERILAKTKYSRRQFERMSVDDLMIDFGHKAYPMPLRYYSLVQPMVCREVEETSGDDKSKRKKRLHKTIADPMNPVFRHDGTPVSKCLYNNRLDSHYKDFVVANLTIDSREEFVKNKYLERRNVGGESVEKKYRERQGGSRGGESEKAAEQGGVMLVGKDKKEVTNENQKACRRSLSLPLKPMCDTEQNATQNCALKKKVLLCRTPTTPLTTKLSLLAFEEKIECEHIGSACVLKFPRIETEHIDKIKEKPESFRPLYETNFCREMSELQSSFIKYGVRISLKLLKKLQDSLTQDSKPLAAPSEVAQLKNVVKSAAAKGNKGNIDNQTGDVVPSSLFVCTQQNMTILLVLDQNVEKNPDLILSLWEMSSGTLRKVESVRNKTLANLSTCNNNSSYSFLSLDSQWGTVQRSGPWGDEELKIVGSLHSDLIKAAKMTEIIVRNEDSVVYGYSCGGSKIFYRQGGCSSAGLPTPADLMGVVTLKARRRLERDRDIVLL